MQNRDTTEIQNCKKTEIFKGCETKRKSQFLKNDNNNDVSDRDLKLFLRLGLNTRHILRSFMERENVDSEEPWMGFEQEFFLLDQNGEIIGSNIDLASKKFYLIMPHLHKPGILTPICLLRTLGRRPL